MLDKSLDSSSEEILDFYFSGTKTRIFLHNLIIREVLTKKSHLVYYAQQLIKVSFDSFYLLHFLHFKLPNQVEYLHILVLSLPWHSFFEVVQDILLQLQIHDSCEYGV